LISLYNFLCILGVQKPERFSNKDAVYVAIFCEKLGYSLIPDFRHYIIHYYYCYYKQNSNINQSIVLFQGGHGPDFEPTELFRQTGVFIRLGSILSQSEGVILRQKEAFLEKFIDNNCDLTETQKISLQAFLHWSLHCPQTLVGLKLYLRKLTETKRQALGQFLLEVAQADGKIAPQEIKKLEQLYAAIGLDKNQVFGGLYALASGVDQVKVAPREFVPTLSLASSKSE
jgi:tellurite resistance protein